MFSSCFFFFFFSSRRRHTRCGRDWSSDVCSSDLNDRIDDFLYVDTYNINNSNNELSLGFSRKGNKNITWETNTNINLGIEFELLKGRLSGSIEYFNRRTTDMLNRFSVPLSLEIGRASCRERV